MPVLPRVLDGPELRDTDVVGVNDLMVLGEVSGDREQYPEVRCYLFGSISRLRLEGALKQSPWRVNDAVASDSLRDIVASLTALLLALGRSSGSVDEALEELRGIRREVFLVDGFDRRATDRLAIRLNERIRELQGTS